MKHLPFPVAENQMKEFIFGFIFSVLFSFVIGSQVQLKNEPKDVVVSTLDSDVNSSISEYNEVVSFSNLLAYIEIICQEALIHKNQLIAIDLISALYDVAEGIYKEHAYKEILSEDEESVNYGTFKSSSEILVSDSNDSEEDEDEEFGKESAVIFDFISMLKSKMMKNDPHDEEVSVEEEEESGYLNEMFETASEDLEHEAIVRGENIVEVKEEKRDDEAEESDEEDIEAVPVRHKFVPKGKSKGGNRRGGGIGRLVNSNTVNMAGNMMAASMMTTNYEEEDFETSEASLPPSNSLANPLDNAILMEQLQQQLMSQILGQLTANNPELGQMASILQEERGKLSQVIGVGADGVAQVNQEGMVQFLRTSALPKLLNSAIKGKTGIDVLKSLALLLRVLNEGLGVFEVVLKVLIRVTRTVRYYSLCASSVVADMAREDNLKPIVDLSVSLDSVPEFKAKKSTMHRVTKMFTKSLKKASNSGGGAEDPDGPNSPFTLALQAVLSKARDYTVQFHQLPPKLLLALIHTIFSELEKRNGIIRHALARKQHKTLLGLQTSTNEAVEMIYKAIILKDPETGEHLTKVPSMIFTEILISLISTVKMEPAYLESHVTKVTDWVKPFMAILDENAQLSMLNYLLNNPEVEDILLSQQPQEQRQEKKLIKTFNWSSAKKLK